MPQQVYRVSIQFNPYYYIRKLNIYARSTNGLFIPSLYAAQPGPISPMANSHHDPVFAQLERQQLTASLLHLIMFHSLNFLAI